MQVYVGLDSAPTATERVDLALAEMDRTGAFDRSLIMLVSPTGTGYVNYVAVAAAQYLTRGDVATVTMQYSKRPSPLSLGKVKDAREQNRLLWLRILERLRDRPDRGRGSCSSARASARTPARTSSCTGAPSACRRWASTARCGSGRRTAAGGCTQVTGPDRLDVDRDAVAVVNDFAQLEQLGDGQAVRLRYVLVSHDNDGVTKFGPDLLDHRPALAGRRTARGRRPVDGASPRGIPPGMRWRPITTFFQSLVDMKNAQIPGAYRAWAHDYRPDLPRFISEVFDLPASPEQLAGIESASQRETFREQLFQPRPSKEVDTS